MTPYIATAALAISSARSYLNDFNAVAWSDAVLFPKLQEAHRELSAKLIANGVAAVRNQTAIISVPALAIGTTGPINLPSTPSNMIVPISLSERDPGDDLDDLVLMTQVDFVPNVDPIEDLIYWAFLGQQIQLVGATSNKEVQLRYKGSLTMPLTVNDTLGISYAELYLGPRVASLALPDRKDLLGFANVNLLTVIQYNIVGEQGVPKRRIGYRRTGYRRRIS